MKVEYMCIKLLYVGKSHKNIGAIDKNLWLIWYLPGSVGGLHVPTNYISFN